MISKLPRETRDKLFKEYSSVITKITGRILKDQIEADNFDMFIEVQNLVSTMVNDFNAKYQEFKHVEMNDDQHEESVNIINEALLNIGGKYDFFTPDENIVGMVIVELIEFMLHTEIAIQKYIEENGDD